MASAEVVIQVSQDVERRLANLIALASDFRSRIYIITPDKKINAKSLMGMMSLVSNTGDTIKITAEGDDEKEAVSAMVSFLSR